MVKNKLNKQDKYEEKELDILRLAVDKAEKRGDRKAANAPQVKKIIAEVEFFLRQRKLICYGGTAINNILPQHDQFYDKSLEIPDYDFYSPNALKDAKDLADIYHQKGFPDVEAKSGVHHGTFKVYVNFIPVADITQLDPDLFKTMKRETISVNGILYAPPNFLRMAMYLELSRPKGDVSRWEKVLKRLILLNKHHPLKNPKCDETSFQRSMEAPLTKNKSKEVDIYNIVKNSFMNQEVVFFGGFANTLYSRYMPNKLKRKLQKTPDFDILSTDPKTTCTIVKERLNDEYIKNIEIIKHKGVGEIIAPHYEIKVGNDSIAFVYEPLACHSYNVIKIDGRPLKIATIDTMLSFYLAFLYTNRPYYQPDRLLCMSQYLFKVQQKNRLKQKVLLRRFSISCYGTQATLESMRQEKTNKYEELKNKKKSNEYEEWFLKYTPATDSKKTKKAKSVNKPTNVKPKKKTKKINPAKKKVKRKKTRRVMFSWK
jgi:hypothetical protein